MDDPASTPQNGQLHSGTQRATPQSLFPVPFALALGLIVFVLAVLNQMITAVPSAYLQQFTFSCGLTSGAAVCFLYAFQYGGIVARILATVCLLPVFWNVFNLLWAIVGEYKLLRV